MQVYPELLAKCQKNDRKAHNELYKCCFGYLLAICLRYSKSRDDAEALVNLGFLKIITNLDKYNEQIPFKSWASKVMVNTIIDEYRRDKKHRENTSGFDIDEIKSQHASSLNDAALELEAEELRTMVKQLPEMSQKVFNLYAIDGFSHKEIGSMLNISDGTSKWHVSFARKLLQEMIQNAVKKMLTVTL